jgi:hypothetical protein
MEVPTMSEASGDATAEFLGRLRADSIASEELAGFLDGLSHEERLAATRATRRRDQRRLYSAVDGYRELSLLDFVAPSVAPLATVRHFGKNTLPAFTQFEKRFCRPADADPAEPKALWGFNFQTMQPLTGPGYFVARDDPDRREVLVDYHQVPASAPSGWPNVQANDRGRGRLVYGYMIDTLRRVSEHVTIGSAARKGKDLGSWFILVREV